MKRDYQRLSIEEFGRQLLTSGDLDPVYIMLSDGGLGGPQLHRWLIAYWCLYHCGAASYLSELEGDKFWDGLLAAARNEEPAPTGGRWPRGHERRHFRGVAANNAVVDYRVRYGKRPEQMVHYIAHLHETRPTQKVPFKAVADRAKEHTLFGPWMAFKVADMVDRVLQVPVDFHEADVFMFKDPVEAAIMLWLQRHGYNPKARPKDTKMVIREVVMQLTVVFGEHKAPPLGDRPVGLQEIETILCKWKSHMNGHYPLLNDITEIRAGMRQWQDASETCRSLLMALPSGEAQ